MRFELRKALPIRVRVLKRYFVVLYHKESIMEAVRVPGPELVLKMKTHKSR